MEITVKTAKKYDYKLTVEKVDHIQVKDTPFMVHGRYIKANGEQIYNGTVRRFKNRAAAIHFFINKRHEVQYVG